MESNALGKNVFVKPFETCHLSKFQKKQYKILASNEYTTTNIFLFLMKDVQRGFRRKLSVHIDMTL